MWSEQWTPATPVRWSPSSGADPDRWIDLDTAVERLARAYPDETRNAERMRLRDQLVNGVKLRTPWASYTLEAAP